MLSPVFIVVQIGAYFSIRNQHALSAEHSNDDLASRGKKKKNDGDEV
jgi:hypothetical protein